MEHPLVLFEKWYAEELHLTKVRIPTAVCLSTIGIDQFPNARFVSFKEVRAGSFIVTSPLNSRKGIEVKNNPNVALTFWWTETERQLRVQGVATEIEEDLAKTYFDERNLHAKAVASICEQGKEVDDVQLLEERIRNKVAEDKNIDKPQDWGGFSIKPMRIEFMEFKKTRFHDRKLYEFEMGRWHMKQLQP